MSGDRDLVHVFAQHAAELDFASLSREAREAAKKSVVDTLGVILAASGTEPAVRGVLEIVRESGGTPSCTVLGLAHRAPPTMAALANGALAHCLDYDDQTPWGQHCASSIVPAVFAIAERQGGVTGKELLTAVAIGQDIFGRLRRNVDWKKDWNLSTVLAVFSATAAASRVMGLSAERTANAMGIASMQSSGIMEMIAGRGSDLRGLYAGFSAQGAVLATMMAGNGISGIDRMFEGQFGFFNTYFGGRYDREKMVEGLGQEFLGAGTLYKRWPCVGTAHSHMKAMIDLMVEHDLQPSDLQEVNLHVGDYHTLMSEPLEERRAPATLADAKFSLPFLVSVAGVRRGMAVADFTEAGLRNAEVLAVGAKVRLVQDASLDWKTDMPPGRVEVVTRNGRRWLREGRNVPGNAESPLTWDDVCNKFRECASASALPPAHAKIERVLGLAANMDELANATELIRGLA